VTVVVMSDCLTVCDQLQLLAISITANSAEIIAGFTRQVCGMNCEL
jgi:hypothetical protein